MYNCAVGLRHKITIMHYSTNTKVLSMLLFVMALFTFSNIKAIEKNTGTLKGKVTAKGQALAGVVVNIGSINKNALTDDDGVYAISNIVAGKYEVNIILTGYETVKKNVNITANKTTTLDVSMALSQNELDEVVISGSNSRYKYDEVSNSLRLSSPIKEIPQNIQVVSATALADQQVIDMGDGVIRNVSGATRLEHWGNLYARINMRGSRIASFRNGVNVVNSSWGPLTEDMSFVDHIEFVKGPAGFMLANGDPSGLYNVVTKKPTGKGFNGAASFTLGSYDLYRTTLDLDGNIGNTDKVSYRLNLMGQTKNSFRPNEFNNRYSIAPVISYNIDDRTKLTVEYVLQHVKMSNVGSYYVFGTDGYATAPPEVTTITPALEPTVIDDNSIYINLQHQLNDNWKVTAQTAYFDYKQEGSSIWPSAVNPDGTMIRNVSIWDAASQMKSGQVYLNGDVNTGAVHHNILAGMDIGTKSYMADWSQAYDLDSPGAEFNTENPEYTTPVNGYPEFDRSLSLRERAALTGSMIDQQYTGLYLQDELGFFDNKLRVTAAVRYTAAKNVNYGTVQAANRFTPRAGISYSIDNNTAVYGLYDQAFVPQAGIKRSGEAVQPVTGNNIEAGVKRDWFDGKWNTTVSVYRIIKNHELTSDPTNTAGESFSVELGQKIAQGVEFDLKGELARGLNLIANYAYTDAKVTDVAAGVTGIAVGDRIPGFAKHNVNAWLSYKILNGPVRGLGISAGCSYMIDRDTWNWGVPGMQDLPDYFRLDGGLFWERRNVRVAANVFNILDDYLYSGSYYATGGGYYYWQAEAPLNMRFSVSYKF